MSAPDGYTLLLTVSTNAVNATPYTNLNFSFSRDLVPVPGWPHALRHRSPVRDRRPRPLPELIASAKANPGRVNFASKASARRPHVAGELFKMMAGIDLVHVPYLANYNTDFWAARSSLPSPRWRRSSSLSGTAAARDRGDDGDAIGCAARRALDWQFLPGYDAAGWYGICAPAGTPADASQSSRGHGRRRCRSGFQIAT